MSRRVILNRPLHFYEAVSTVDDTSKGASAQVIAYDARFLALNGDLAKSEALIEQEIKFSAAVDNAVVSLNKDTDRSAGPDQSTGKDPAARQVQDLLKVILRHVFGTHLAYAYLL